MKQLMGQTLPNLPPPPPPPPKRTPRTAIPPSPGARPIAPAAPVPTPAPAPAAPTAAAPGSEPAPSYSLFDPYGVAMASLLGTVLAGGVALAVNYRRLGRLGAAIASVLVAVLVIGGTVAARLVFDEQYDRLPKFVHWMPLLIGAAIMFVLAHALLRRALQEHVRRDGVVASLLAAALIGGAARVVLLAVDYGINAAQRDYDERHTFHYTVVEDVAFRGDATEDDARALGDILQKAKYFDHRQPALVRLHRTGSHTTVSFVGNGAWNDPQNLDAFRKLGQLTAAKFGKPLVVRLVDQKHVLHTELKID